MIGVTFLYCSHNMQINIVIYLILLIYTVHGWWMKTVDVCCGVEIFLYFGFVCDCSPWPVTGIALPSLLRH
jgi:hypothetical protein